MEDVAKKLRGYAMDDGDSQRSDLMYEAASEIERLRKVEAAAKAFFAGREVQMEGLFIEDEDVKRKAMSSGYYAEAAAFCELKKLVAPAALSPASGTEGTTP